MSDEAGPDLDAIVRELTELGVGAAILGLRQLNIARRQLSETRPELVPAIDAALDQIEQLAAPASAALGAALEAVSRALDGDNADKMAETGRLISELGPELLRLSGLTNRP